MQTATAASQHASLSAMGNQAFAAVARQATVARQHHDPDPATDPATPPLSPAVVRAAQDVIAAPIRRIADECENLTDRSQFRRMIPRLRAAMGGFGALRVPPGSIPARRLLASKAHVEIALGLMEAATARRGRDVVRQSWERSYSILRALARLAPRPAAGAAPAEGDVDKRQLIRSSVMRSVRAAIDDLPRLYGPDVTAEQFAEFRATHLPVVNQIAGVVDLDPGGVGAITQFMRGSRSFARGRCPTRSTRSWLPAGSIAPSMTWTT